MAVTTSAAVPGHLSGRLSRSRTPGRDWAEIKARRWRWRRRRTIALKNEIGNIPLPRPGIPVGVADSRVPNDRVHTKIAGLHRGVPWAPVTWPRGRGIRTAGPRMVIQRHRARLGLSSARAHPHHARDAAPQQHSRCYPYLESLHKPGIRRGNPACAGNTRKARRSVHGGPFAGCRAVHSLAAKWTPPALLPIPTPRRIHRFKLTDSRAGRSSPICPGHVHCGSATGQVTLAQYAAIFPHR